MGTVYVARDTSLLREVALKTIRTGTDVDPELRERFFREARVCAGLQHPNIVTVYEFGEQDVFAYIAMELLQGADLRKVIEQPDALPMTVKLEVMIQIGEALAHAHRQGIVHRDVKPSNLFLCKDNRAKVLDFGIAHLPSSRLTVVGRVMGTPNYMAPEQVLGQNADGRADLFSAAVVFFEFLVGRHPFQASLIPRRIVDGEPDSIFDHDSSIPLPFEKIFARALDKDPSKRYTTGDEFASDIRAVLDAIRMNSSPKFSKVALSSARAVPLEPRPSKVLNEAAGAQDPEAQRLAEFLRILPEFDDAIERKLPSRASQVLDQLRRLEAVDVRFSDSVKLCESRLASLNGLADTSKAGGIGDATRMMVPVGAARGAAAGAVQENVAIKTQAPGPGSSTLCPVCGVENRLSAAFCCGCGSRLSGAGTKSGAEGLKPEPEASKPGLEASRPDASRKAPVVVPRSAPERSAPERSAPERSAPEKALKATGGGTTFPKTWILAGAGVVIVLAVVLAVLILNGAVKEEPYIATAMVRAPKSPLYGSGDGIGTAVAALDQGTVLHVLKPPASPKQLLPVQPMVAGKLAKSGYIRREFVGAYSLRDGASGLALARSLGSGPSPAPDDLARQLAVYETLGSQFRNRPEGRRARMEAARLELEAAKSKKQQGLPKGDWSFWVEKSQQEISTLPSDPEVAAIVSEGDALLAEDKPVLPEPQPPSTVVQAEPAPQPLSPVEAKRYLNQAEAFKTAGEYGKALYMVNLVLRANPGDEAARESKKRILDAKKMDDALSK